MVAKLAPKRILWNEIKAKVDVLMTNQTTQASSYCRIYLTPKSRRAKSSCSVHSRTDSKMEQGSCSIDSGKSQPLPHPVGKIPKRRGIPISSKWRKAAR